MENTHTGGEAMYGWILVIGLLATRLEAQGVWVAKPTERTADGKRWTDYRNPVADSGAAGVGYYRMTVCDNGGAGRWQLFPGLRKRASVKGKGGHAVVQAVKGNDGAVSIRGVSNGSNDFEISMVNAQGADVRMHLRVRVVSCRKAGVRGVAEKAARARP
jgi:hypothetical protein